MKNKRNLEKRRSERLIKKRRIENKCHAFDSGCTECYYDEYHCVYCPKFKNDNYKPRINFFEPTFNIPRPTATCDCPPPVCECSPLEIPMNEINDVYNDNNVDTF
jgi:hypothetical protein